MVYKVSCLSVNLTSNTANTRMTRTVWVEYSVNDFGAKGFSSSPSHRIRFTWSPEMEKLFLNAVYKLGIKATPSLLLQEINVPGLTRNQVSSHLQKYRCKVRRSTISSPVDKLSVNYLLNWKYVLKNDLCFKCKMYSWFYSYYIFLPE